MRRSFVAIVVLLLANTPSPAFSAGGGKGEGSRFLFSGNGRLRLQPAESKTGLDVQYRRHDGTYDPSALQSIRHFFRSHSDNREGDISLRLIELLGFVQERFHPRSMTLMSGYRSPEHNAGIRAAGAQAAKASLHTEGLAADVKFSGVNLRDVWVQLRELETGGAGYYRSGSFLHIDTGPARFWEETTSRVSEDLSAGNARVFARTDFDRYADLRGAEIKLHSVTAFPLRVATEAKLVGAANTATVQLAPGPGTTSADGCIEIPEYASAYVLKVIEASHSAYGHLMLKTCEPRLEKTPDEIESNIVECGR